jgi:hypothetical protein
LIGERKAPSEPLERLSLWEFLSVRLSDDSRYHVVSPSDQIRWFVNRFIERSAATFAIDLAIEAGPQWY